MKILIAISYFYPKIGGAEKVALDYAQGYKRFGYDVIVVTTNHIQKKFLREKIKGVDVIRLPSLLTISNSPFNPFWFFYLRRILKSENPDLIQAHTPVPGLADMFFVTKGKTKFTIRYHAGSMKKNNIKLDPFIGLYENTFLKYMLRRSDYISTSYGDFIRGLVGPGKAVDVIQPGVDFRTFKPDTNIIKTHDVIFVGRIERSSSWKGLGTLLEAFVAVVRQCPAARLKVVGTGDAVVDYKNLSKTLGISKSVDFVGVERDKKLVRSYNSAKILVLPSETDAESFGIVLIEAMACGLPVIGTKVGGVPNVVKDHQNGLLIPAKNPNKLAESMLELLQNEKSQRDFGQVGLNFVRQNFSQQDIIHKQIDALDRVFRGINR